MSAIPPASDNLESLGLYVHWPFCASKCPYCDFNAHLLPDGLNAEAWANAYLRELAFHAGELNAADRLRPVTSVFFGGGTPSLMPPQIAARVLDETARLFGFASGAEVSLEANPGSTDAAKLSAFAAAGVNRFSLGVQALNDKDLAGLGRQHSAADALTAIDAARATGAAVSIDLIYARPEQTLAAWRDELDRALALGLPHLSLYQLTIEPGTQFEARVRRGELIPMPDERQEDLWDETVSRLTGAGYENYEVSNFAKPGAACQHNLTYWRYEDYVGIGPGAHGRLSSAGRKTATRNQRMPQLWLDAVSRDGHGRKEALALSGEDQAFEQLMMGLRISEGVPLYTVRPYLNAGKLTLFADEGWLSTDDDRLRLTPSGRARLNAILSALWNG